MAAGLMLMSIAACSKSSQTADAAAETTAAGSEAAASESGSAADAKEAEASSTEAPSVAILLNGTLGDKAFFDSAAAGGKLMEEQLGSNVKVVEMTYDETKWLPTLIDFSEDDAYDIIITGTWQMSEKLQEVASQYPDKKYILYDSTVDYDAGDVDNVYSIEYKQNECSYLAGALAALTTKTGTIGFVGGMENAVIDDFMVGYIQGAVDTNPDIKVLTAFVGNFNDNARAKELTLAQINQNADVVYQAASTAGLGVIDACLEKGIWCIGVDSDQAASFMDTDPAKADVILTSALKRVDESIFQAVEKDAKGELTYGQRVVMGLAEQSVGLAKNDIYKKNVSEENQKKIDELEAKIIDGSIKVDTAFGKTTDEIQAIKDSVK